MDILGLALDWFRSRRKQSWITTTTWVSMVLKTLFGDETLISYENSDMERRHTQ